ncbi:MAG TPA: hypothetical protein ENK23_00115 [Sorangium sp.]|nr:hypothetical protein [Sorangium sp.]
MQHGYSWSVYPYCFTFCGMALWEPAPPHDRIPYLLAAAGVEEMAILPGITQEEMLVWLRIALADPIGVGDGDIAAALWEARFEHIRLTIRDDFADADAAAQAKFYAEADDLEAIAQDDLAEVAAMAVTTATTHEQALKASVALALDPAERAALKTQVSADMDRWHDRHLYLLVEALHDAKARDDPALVLKPLAHAMVRLTIREHYAELFATHRTLLDGMAKRYRESRFDGTSGLLTGWMFPSPLLVQLTTQVAMSEAADPAHHDMMLQGLSRVFAALPDNRLADMLPLADKLPPGDARELVFAYVDRSLEGNEEAAVALLDKLSPTTAQRTLSALAALAEEGDATILRPLLISPNRALRCEAMALLADDKVELGRRLLRMLESSDGALRAAALTTMVNHGVRSAGPGLVGLVERNDFSKRPADEQESMFETLFQLNAARAQSLLTDVVLKHGLMADDALDTTRTAAAKLLGKHAINPDPLQALEQATRRRPWNSPSLRTVATRAMNELRNRLRDRAQQRAEKRNQQEAEA